MSTQDFMNNNGKSGRMGRWAPIILILMVVAFFAYGSRSSGSPAGWIEDPAAAFAQAAASKHSLVLAFYSEGCPPCTAMDRRVLGSGPVLDALEGYVPVRLDAWREAELASKYQVSATPTFIIADYEGKTLARTEGYHDVDDFVSFLNRGRLVAER